MDERRRHDVWAGPENDTLWDRVSTACAMVHQHVQVDAVAVSTSRAGCETHVATAGWAEQLEEYQYVLGEGPSPDVIQTGLAVLVPDVRTRAHRWPVFTEKAAASTVAAVFAVPIPDARGNPMGSLTLYRRTPGPLSTAELRHTAVMAGFTAKLLDLDDDPLNPAAPDSRRATVSLAIELLAKRHAVCREDALVLLRAHAFVQDRPLHHIAETVVDQAPWRIARDDDRH
jgi:GAF domain-containing protein